MLQIQMSFVIAYDTRVCNTASQLGHYMAHLALPHAPSLVWTIIITALTLMPHVKKGAKGTL